MLTAINKVRYYRKNGTSAYINWVHKNDYSTVDMTIARFNFLMRQPSRKSIDRELFLMLSVPTWVAAAEEVVAAAEEVVAVEVEEVTSTPSESPFNVNINYDSSTIRELQDICRERGLTIRGTKAEVVLRLRRDDDGITENQPTEDETEAPSQEAAEEELDAPVEETAVTEEVENNDSGQEPDINEEE
jgi:hypothetical protein|tara:strand:- start:1449 stop:2012 length:564 start_codon:yes stop_codon:yes gene_type:complete